MRREDVAAILVVFLVVGAPAVAVHSRSSQEAKKVWCASNLRSLWLSCFNYAAQYGRPNGLMPTETGSDFWLKLKRTPKPLIDKIDPFFCPLAGHDETLDQTSYRGPGRNVNKLADEDPVGADFDGNHGAGKGGNVIVKTGAVSEYKNDDPMWQTAEAKLSGTAPVKKLDKYAALEKRVADIEKRFAELEKTLKEMVELVKQLREKLEKEQK